MIGKPPEKTTPRTKTQGSAPQTVTSNQAVTDEKSLHAALIKSLLGERQNQPDRNPSPSKYEKLYVDDMAAEIIEHVRMNALSEIQSVSPEKVVPLPEAPLERLMLRIAFDPFSGRKAIIVRPEENDTEEGGYIGDLIQMSEAEVQKSIYISKIDVRKLQVLLEGLGYELGTTMDPELKTAFEQKKADWKETLINNLLIRIEDTALPERIQEKLFNLGIAYLGELVSRTPKDMLSAKYFGPKRVEIIQAELKKYGLRLGMEILPDLQSTFIERRNADIGKL